MDEEVTANLARDITTTTLGVFNVTSSSTVTSDAEAVASVSGEDSSGKDSGGKSQSSADGQASQQEGSATDAGAKMPATMPSAGGEASSSESMSSSSGGDTSSGGDSSGVGVAAAVAVNVLTANNTAEVTNGADITATSGAVTIAAMAQDSASAKGIGAAVAMNNSVNIGAGVGLNVITGNNKAYVDAGSSVVQGNGITIEAITPAGQTDNFIAWGAAAAGGKGEAQIAGSVGINVVNFTTEASARGGSDLQSSGGITVMAVADLDPQTLGAAGAFSQGGNAIGATVTVAVLTAMTTASIGGNADAGGAISIEAKNQLLPSTIAIPIIPASADPSATSVAVAGAASSGDVAIGGSFIVNVFTLDATADIGGGSKINKGGIYAPSAGQTFTITADNDTTITSIAGALGLTTGDAGVGVGLDVEIISKTTKAYLDSGAQVDAGGMVSITAESSETMLSIAATAGVADEAGIAASISVAVINTETDAYIGGMAVLNTGAVTISASDNFVTTMIAGSVGAGGSAGIGVANTTLVLNPTVQAYIGGGANVTASGTVSVTAAASESLITIAAGIDAGGDVGVAGSAAVNVLNDTTTAYVGPSAQITTTTTDLTNNPSNLSVNASDDTSVISVAGSLAAGGSVGAGVGVYTKHTNAYIDSGVIATIAGNILVTAESSENLISVSAGVAVGGDAGIAANAGVHIFNLQTRAFIGDDPNNPSGKGPGNVHAQGSIYLSANDMSDINEIVGVLAAGGYAGIGAAVGVNVFSPDTESFIGAGANVTGEGQGSGLMSTPAGLPSAA